MEKTTVLFVGTTSTSATNWFIANLAEDLMKHFIELLVPPRGMLLELGSGQAQGKGILLVLFPKRERVFHRGIQTPRNK